MAKMCPLEGCKSNQGLCLHDKLMVAMGVMAIVGAVAHWGLNLF